MGSVDYSGRTRFLRPSRPVLLLGFFFLLLPAGLTGQEVRGHLLESGTRQPITLGAVTLLDTAFSAVVQTLTNEDGAFLLQAPAPGAYYVLAEALGYAPNVDGILELGSGGSITVEVYLRPNPIEMDSLTVALTRLLQFHNLSEVGYYDRKKMGFGSFISPEEIKRQNPVSAYHLLRQVPDLHLGAQTAAGTRVYLVRGGRPCTPRVYVDGSMVMNDVLTERLGPQNLNPAPVTPENTGLPQLDPSQVDLESRLRAHRVRRCRTGEPRKYPGHLRG